MTDERAFLAFRTGEPVVYKPSGNKYLKITEVIMTYRKNRSVPDHISHHGELVYYFLVLDKNRNSVIRVRAEDLEETTPEPPEEFKAILLKNFARI